MVDKAATAHVRQLYIDPDHAVFDLVPGPLNVHLEECYNELGRPAVTRQTVWAMYLDLLHLVQDHAARLPPLPTYATIEQAESAGSLPLLEGQRDLPFNEEGDHYYMGGVGGGLGLGESSADLTKDETYVPDADHVQRLNELDAEDEPDIIEGGPDIVISDFSDDEGDEELDDWS